VVLPAVEVQPMAWPEAGSLRGSAVRDVWAGGSAPVAGRRVFGDADRHGSSPWAGCLRA